MFIVVTLGVCPYGGGLAHGALVGAIGPAGNLEVSGIDGATDGGALDVVADGMEGIGPPGLPVDAQGAAVDPGFPAAHGALVPASEAGTCLAVEEETASLGLD